MNKRPLLSLLLVCLSITLFAQDPYNGYYNDAIGKRGDALKQALYDIIKNNTYIAYGELWTHYGTTDVKANGDTIWDIYSDIPDGEAPYDYLFYTNQCSNNSGNSEGLCYNREHSVPNSWFGGDATQYEQIYTDLFHLYPTDAYVNNQRGNNPYGVVTAPTWTSQNGSKLGPNAYSEDYTDVVFEPIDAFKGDLARTYFYMSLRYKDKNLSQKPQSCYNGSTLKPWAMAMFKEWHKADVVSSKEQVRNDKVQSIQNNRNPFIDYPELVEYIWGDSVDYAWAPYEIDAIYEFVQPHYAVYPNPAKEKIQIQNAELKIKRLLLCNTLGQVLPLTVVLENPVVEIDMQNLKPGIYFLKIEEEHHTETQKIIIQ